MKDIFCTCIIPTVGRESLSRAVGSVLSQSLKDAEFEIIVVNDSGKPLHAAEWHSSPNIQIVNTNRRERSVARNTGAAMANGRFLHFLDDDDWIAAGAYQHLWELSRTSNAKWLYGTTQLLDRDHEPTIVLKHGLVGNCFLQAMAGEWIPLQASLIDRKLFWKIGGFNILLTGPEDIDLQRRALLESDIAETPNHVAYVVRGEAGSTTDYLLHSQQSRRAREGILDTAGTFQRMHASATSPMWQGHMVRIYLTSLVWNLQHERLSTAVHRLISAVSSVLAGWRHLFFMEFWRSVLRSYKSITFERGIYEAGLNKKDSR